jgi:hypothetical protein
MIASLEQQVKDLAGSLDDEKSMHNEAKEIVFSLRGRVSQLDSKHEEYQSELAELRTRTEKQDLERNKVKHHNVLTDKYAKFRSNRCEFIADVRIFGQID